MGASRGRLTHFTVVSPWGVPLSPVDVVRPVQRQVTDLPLELLFEVIPYLLSIVFAMRNLRLGRGDWRGATRIAVFVFRMNVGEAGFATRLSEVGIVGVLDDLIGGRAQGHALMHAMGMWFAYVALEPYVRRLWPRVLVSWTRLLTGRFRDPLVGRDLLIGVALGATLATLGVATFAVAPRLGLGQVPALTNGGMFEAIGSAGYTSVSMCYAGSICVLNVLQGLFLLLLVRLITRRTDLTLLVGGLLFLFATAAGAAPDLGWRLALLPMAVLLGIACYGAATALAGKSILGDPLEDGPRR